MFDIGFMELVLIGIVALLVVGPEKLPDTIRTAALLIGRAKRSFNQVKADIEREINADDIRRQLHNESILADIEKAKKDANKLIADTKESLDSVNADVNSTLAREKKALDEVLQDETAAPATQAESASEQSPQASAEARPSDAASAADVDSAVTTSDAASPATEESSTPEEDKAAEPTLKPVEDFYNNPPAGVIRLQNGVFQQVVNSEESSDQEPQRKS